MPRPRTQTDEQRKEYRLHRRRAKIQISVTITVGEVFRHFKKKMKAKNDTEAVSRLLQFAGYDMNSLPIKTEENIVPLDSTGSHQSPKIEVDVSPEVYESSMHKITVKNDTTTNCVEPSLLLTSHAADEHTYPSVVVKSEPPDSCEQETPSGNIACDLDSLRPPTMTDKILPLRTLSASEVDTSMAPDDNKILPLRTLSASEVDTSMALDDNSEPEGLADEDITSSRILSTSKINEPTTYYGSSMFVTNHETLTGDIGGNVADLQNKEGAIYLSASMIERLRNECYVNTHFVTETNASVNTHSVTETTACYVNTHSMTETPTSVNTHSVTETTAGDLATKVDELISSDEDFMSSTEEDEPDEQYWRNLKRKGKGKPDDPDFELDVDPDHFQSSSDDDPDCTDGSDVMLDSDVPGCDLLFDPDVPEDSQINKWIIYDDPCNTAYNVNTKKTIENTEHNVNTSNADDNTADNVNTSNADDNTADNVNTSNALDNTADNVNTNQADDDIDSDSESVCDAEIPALCTICGKDFKNDKEFREHSTSVHADVQDKCPYCLKWYPGVRYKNHIYGCMQKKKYCKTCEQQFSSNAKLLRHIVSKHAQFKYKCGKCEHRFPSKDAAFSHVEYHFRRKIDSLPKDKNSKFTTEKRRPLNCPLCPIKINNPRNLEYHIWRKHKNCKSPYRLNKNHQCTICSHCFAIKSQLKYHMNTTHGKERPYFCDVCKKSYKTGKSLREHKQIHASIGKYMCNHCGRLFKRKSYLRQHERIHTGEARYTCDKCGKGFAQKNSLNYHINKHHGDSDDGDQKHAQRSSVKDEKKHTRNMKDNKTSHCEAKARKCKIPSKKKKVDVVSSEHETPDQNIGGTRLEIRTRKRRSNRRYFDDDFMN